MNAPTAALDAAQVWAWLGDVPDPEIPVISVVDLGIVRAVDVVSSDECIVTITPTYSGCPAMQVIADAVTDALRSHGVAKVTLVNQLAPAWTTDWMSEAGKAKLKGYGIAPPQQQVIDISGLQGWRQAPAHADAGGDLPELRFHAYAADQPVRLHAVQGPVQMPGLPRTV